MEKEEKQLSNVTEVNFDKSDRKEECFLSFSMNNYNVKLIDFKSEITKKEKEAELVQYIKMLLECHQED